MDTRTGDILTRKQVDDCFKKMGIEIPDWVKEMQEDPTLTQLKRKPMLRQPITKAIGRVGRNEPCPCGSKKKFKFCCLNV